MAALKEDPLAAWFEGHVKPFLLEHAPDKLASLQSDFDRLQNLRAQPDEVTVCLLGNSGVGKSTLLNALAAEDVQVLPAGGIGPLTAQATEVRYSEIPRFSVTYHSKGKLWNIAFALEARLRRRAQAAGTAASAGALESDLASELNEDERSAAIKDAESIDKQLPDEPLTDTLEGFVKQAKNLICGNQFAERSLEYLVDGLRVACGKDAIWGAEILPEDSHRLARVRKIMAGGKERQRYERVRKDDMREFMEDLKTHAAGFLSPLIEHIEVGWPSDVLKHGVKLVDLPGVGIAHDTYRDVTRSFVRDKARAVIVVVDRAGPTESTIDLLRTSGYWDRLVGAADDPASDPCSLLLAVTKVDDVMNEEWARQVATMAEGQPKPKKRQVFESLVEDFKPRMHGQISEQLGKITPSSNASVQEARTTAQQSLLASLEVHPVSAPEYRRLIIDDEDDRPFLQEREQTGIPQLRESLQRLAAQERAGRQQRRREVRQRLMSSCIAELELIQAAWRENTRAAEAAERVEQALALVLGPKQEEYRQRGTAFRTFLKETLQARIEGLVEEARSEARQNVQQYLRRLQSANWATLRAAVRRGGTFYGSMHINLPDDIASYFQEPMAAVWGQKLLRDIRRRTTELAQDIEQLVNELCEWAEVNAGADVNAKLLEAQQSRVRALTDQMKAVGREAVDEMRATVKSELNKTIRAPIETACQRFVRSGNDIGPGVKARILNLFEALAKDATDAAKAPALSILNSKAQDVRRDIEAEFRKGGDPLQDTANVIVQRQEDKQRRSDAQKRKAVLARIDAALAAAAEVSVEPLSA